jgi:hydroxybutyrate-dimer hydrolase
MQERKMRMLMKPAVALVAASALAAGIGPVIAEAAEPDETKIIHTHYDGVTNDLLTAGLGKTGLGGSTPPGFADPLHPTAEELRRSAIYNNYRALIDPTPGGGYGTLYGPNVKSDGTVTASEGLIPGDEYIAYERGGHERVTMLVQVPDSFDPGNSCIVATPSSGSRGVYGAIATAGEWGLKRGCAVAYTDKGTGTGAHNLQNNTINLIRGERASASFAARGNFIAPISESQRTAFNDATPNRFAFKHAHSQANPEKDWGRNVLRSIEFALEVLKDKFASRANISRRNTIVIASSVSNGGGASVRAVEQDDDRLIDGLAVGEPNVNPKFSSDFSIVQGNGPPLLAHSRPLMNYITLVNVFQGCANLAPANARAGLNSAGSPARCADLHAKALLSSTTLVDQAAEAQKIINDFGILPEQNLVQPGYWFANVPQSISVTYSNTYGRFSVLDNLCGYSFAANTGVPGGAPVPLAAAAEAAIFGASSGIPPTSGVALINNAAPGGPKEDRGSTPNQNLDGALCLRSLATGKDAVTGAPLGGSQQAQASRIANGVEEVLATGRLRRIPAIFVTGRNDGILPPNFTSRAYFGLNKVVEGSTSSLHYYEITNTHHLDALNQFPGYNANYVPLHRYYIQAMDLMYDHLRHGRPLPPSQVVHTIPRGPGAPLPPPITPANVPPIAEAPPPGSQITFAAGQVKIPD